jgi:hypothetical protein
MKINGIGYLLFWKVMAECRLTLPELCKLQRVCKKWRRLLCPAPCWFVYWDEVFGTHSGHDMACQVMLALHPKIRSLPYHGSELAVVWFKREQIQLEARLGLHRSWAKNRSNFLSAIARHIIYTEHLWVCVGCGQLFHGPKTPDHSPECCRRPKLRHFSFKPHKSNIFALAESSICARCGIYGRRPRNRHCVFCSS